MSGNSRPILYALECDHGAPGVGYLVNGQLYCAWCQEKKQIVSVIEYEWCANCKDCVFVRWAGLSKQNAGIFANGHISRNPSHGVQLMFMRNPTAVTTAEKMRKWQGNQYPPAKTG